MDGSFTSRIESQSAGTRTHAQATSQVDDPETLAMRAIERLETYLRKTHGITVPMGIELEFSCSYPPDQPGLRRSTSNPHRLPTSSPQHDPAPSDDVHEPLYRKKRAPLPVFRHSPSVAYLYRECDILMKPLLYKNEIVFTHKGAYGPSDQPRLHNLAQAVHHVRCQMTGERGACPTVEQFYPAHRRSTSPQAYFVNPTFAPYVKGAGNYDCLTHGMHINFSFLRADGSPVLEMDSLMMTTRFFTEQLNHLLHENLWLIAPEERNYNRYLERIYRWRSGSILTDQILSQQLVSADYIENKMPAANTNPYYAIMLNLAATALLLDHKEAGEYDGLLSDWPDKQDMEFWHSSLQRNYPLPQTLKDAKNQFTQGHQLTDLLNRLEPELGDRFHAAIMRIPPGQERSAYRETTGIQR